MADITVHFIIGLSGSGKSTFIRDIVRKIDHSENITVLMIDDFGSNMDRLCFKIIDDSKTKHNKIFLSSHMFCKKKILDNSIKYMEEKYPDVKIIYTYFDNNIQQACNNLFWREKQQRVKELVKTNRSLSKTYYPPKNSRNVAVGDGPSIIKFRFKEKIKTICQDWDKAIINEKENETELEDFVLYYSKLFEKLRSTLTIYS